MTKIVRRMSTTKEEIDPKLLTAYSTKISKSNNDEVSGSNLEEEEYEEDEEESDSMYTEISDCTNMSDYIKSQVPMQEEMKKESSQMSSKGNKAQGGKSSSHKILKIKTTLPGLRHKTPMMQPRSNSSSPNYNIKNSKQQSFFASNTNSTREILGMREIKEEEGKRWKEHREKHSINSSQIIEEIKEETNRSHIIEEEKEETSSLAPNVDENIESLFVPATVSKSMEFPIRKMWTGTI